VHVARPFFIEEGFAQVYCLIEERPTAALTRAFNGDEGPGVAGLNEES
jgi:hypothetical protein